jgi:hypothetical protein
MTKQITKAPHLQVGSSGSSFNKVGGQSNQEERGELHDGSLELDWLPPDTYTRQVTSAHAILSCGSSVSAVESYGHPGQDIPDPATAAAKPVGL